MLLGVLQKYILMENLQRMISKLKLVVRRNLLLKGNGRFKFLNAAAFKVL